MRTRADVILLLHKKFTWPDFGRVYTPIYLPVATPLMVGLRLKREERIYLPSQIMTEKVNNTVYSEPAAGCQRSICLSMLAAYDKIKLDSY